MPSDLAVKTLYQLGHLKADIDRSIYKSVNHAAGDTPYVILKKQIRYGHHSWLSRK